MTRTVARAILPHPFLSALIALTWLLLTHSLGLGNLLFAGLLGLLIPQLTLAYWPDAPQTVRTGRLITYTLIVIWDIAVANVVVAWIVLTKSNKAMKSGWISIPLEIRQPEAITILAGTITLTPGTVSADLSDEGHCLLVHCLDAEDPDAVREEIKTRYEARLKEIFP